MVIKLVKVPKELCEQARYTQHLCEHIYQKVARGAKVRDEEIGSIGSHRHHNDDYKSVLRLNCGYAYIERRFTGFEVVKNTPLVPTKEMLVPTKKSVLIETVEFAKPRRVGWQSHGYPFRAPAFLSASLLPNPGSSTS